MNMTQKMFVATVRNFGTSRREAYFDSNEDAMKWVEKMIEDKELGGIASFVVDNRAKSGTDIQVTVEDGDEWYVMDASVLMVGESASYSNLRVYF